MTDPDSGENLKQRANDMNIGTTFTAQELFGKQLELGDAKALLTGVSLEAVLEFCGLLNALAEVSADHLQGWQSQGGAELMNRLIVDLFEPVYRKRAWNLYAEEGSLFCPIMPAAVHALMVLACKYCSETGGHSLDKDRIRQRVTKVLFSLQGEFVNKAVIKALDTRSDVGLREAFPFMTRSILASRSRSRLDHELGRLHGMVTIDDIGSVLLAHDGISVNKWFRNSFGFSAWNYFFVARGICGAAARFDHEKPHWSQIFLPDTQLLELFRAAREPVGRLLQLMETTPERVRKTLEPVNMTQALYLSDHFLLYPLLRMKNGVLITSFDAVSKKLLRGLPYLATMSASARGGESIDAVVKGARGGFGHIFEGYVGWLFNQWLGVSGVQVIRDYRIRLEGMAAPSNVAQCDFLLLCEDVGFAVEAKAKVPPREIRQTGDLGSFLKLLSPIAQQASRAARALAQGDAYYDDGCNHPIPAPRRIYPIGLLFEHLPIRFPWSMPLEHDLQEAVGFPIFEKSPALGQMQFVDLDMLESFDEQYDLPTEARFLLNALQMRADSDLLRFMPFDRIRRGASNRAGSKVSLLNRLADESRESTSMILENSCTV